MLLSEKGDAIFYNNKRSSYPSLKSLYVNLSNFNIMININLSG